MASPFIRAVDSFKSLKSDGTSLEFFRGDNYITLHNYFANTVREFSLKNLNVERISHGQSDEIDSLSPYVLHLRDKTSFKMFDQLSNLLEFEIFKLIQSACDQITGQITTAQRKTKRKRIITDAGNESASDFPAATIANTVLTRDLDEHFDDLSSACDLRNFLLRLRNFAKRQSKIRNKDAALIIEV